MRTRVTFLLLFFLSSISLLAQERTYYVYVASEAADKITAVRFGPRGAAVDHDLATGIMPIDIDGPHGLAVSPDKKHYYVSIAHGQPLGSLWKYSAGDDQVLGRVTLGMFPATMDVSPDGDFVYVVNFNLHGDMVPSSVSVVATEDMTEIARIQTCAMPHGSRLNAGGSRQYRRWRRWRTSPAARRRPGRSWACGWTRSDATSSAPCIVSHCFRRSIRGA